MLFLNWLLAIVFFLFPLGQLERLPIEYPGVSIYLHDLILAVIWGYLLIDKKRRQVLVNSPLAKKLWLFIGIAFFSWLVNLPRFGSQSFLGLGYLVRFVLYSGIYFAMLNIKTQIFGLLNRTLFLTAVLGMVQYLFSPDLRYLKLFGWDDHYFRMTGTFLDPNFFGLIVVMAIGLEIFQKIVNHKPYLLNLKVVFYLICLALTYSRASYLAWLVLLIGWTIDRVFAEPIKRDTLYFFRIFFRPFKIFTTGCLLLVTLLIFYFVPRPSGEGGNLMRTASIIARERNWSQSWEVVKKNWLFGVGFNNYQLVSLGNAKADNSFLLVWATTGILGLVAFLWFLTGLKPWWLIAPVIVHSFFNNTIFYPFVMILIWSFVDWP